MIFFLLNPKSLNFSIFEFRFFYSVLKYYSPTKSSGILLSYTQAMSEKEFLPGGSFNSSGLIFLSFYQKGFNLSTFQVPLFFKVLEYYRPTKFSGTSFLYTQAMPNEGVYRFEWQSWIERPWVPRHTKFYVQKLKSIIL